uniref:RRM domain-containing protein n=1 Tax=Aegilops tauschii subsp. strangulata TaxID=200361 RepID=A0A453RW20_AEGTS
SVSVCPISSALPSPRTQSPPPPVRVRAASMAGAGIHPFHQQWPPQAAVPAPPAVPPPPPVPGAPDAAARPGSDEVRTIFITGLPVDVKERELHNLLRWLPGFEASQINFKGDQPMGFALFSYAHHAIAAKAALQCRIWSSMPRPSRRCTSRWPRRTYSSKEVWELMQMLWTKVNACELVETILILRMLLLHSTHPHQLFPCGELQVIWQLLLLIILMLAILCRRYQ